MSVNTQTICNIIFNVLFYFDKYLFCCIRTTVSNDYISNPVYYRSNSSLEKKPFATNSLKRILMFLLYLYEIYRDKTNISAVIRCVNLV